MTQQTLPSLLEAFRQAVNAGDTDAFIALFAEDGVVDDWGRRFAGHRAILGWNAKEMIGAKGTLTYGEVLENQAGRVVLNTHWASSFFTGPGIFTFVIDDLKIRELKISES
jgi:ketosteroid isomerase-like protein